MKEQSSSNAGARSGFPSWPSWSTVLIGIVVIKAVLSLAVKPGSFLFSYSGISYFILLLLATGFAIRNGLLNTLGSRLFWVFLAIAYGLWSFDQGILIYYDLILHIDAPDNSIADPVLFLHIVPLMAAAATLPSRRAAGRGHYRVILDSLALLLFWGLLYAYVVFPYEYLSQNSARYSVRFDALYLIENWVLVLAVGILSLRVHAPWKAIYLHLLGASTLYALSSAFANLAIDSGGYLNGKLYGLGLLSAVCWFVWIPLRARQLEVAEASDARSDRSSGSQASAWAMLLVVMISIPIVWELFHRDEAAGLRTFRLLAAIAAIVCLSSAAYIKEYLAKSKLAHDLGLANDRLRLSLVAGKAVGWEYDVKTGRNSWSRDLQNMFGIASDRFFGGNEDFYRYVHPEDRQPLAEALANARETRKAYSTEFRILKPDGTVRWFAATGQFYFRSNGTAERMLGMAADITERKQAEDALANVSLRVIEAEERERKRISEDLHEDIGQQLTMLAIEIEQLKQDHSGVTAGLAGRLDVASAQVLKVLDDVKASAHELHSPRLEYLGLAPLMRAFCNEFSNRKGVTIDFTSNDLPAVVPPEVSICFFRVLQEALHNGLQHSGVRRFEVQAWGMPDEIQLRVCDSGTGFDPATAMKRGGLGLIRMEQRLKLLKGTLSIESQPQQGTTVLARVPRNWASDSEGAVAPAPTNSSILPA
jgi:PAS domain S-box-containing protein